VRPEREKLRRAARWLRSYDGPGSISDAPNTLTTGEVGWILWPYVLATIAIAIIVLDPYTGPKHGGDQTFGLILFVLMSAVLVTRWSRTEADGSADQAPVPPRDLPEH
jgi:hypothetical protein